MSLDVAQYETTASVRRVIDRSLRETMLGGFTYNLPTDHLSPSQVAMGHRCPEQYRQRYVLGHKERPAEAPVMGSAVHAALERNFAQKVQTHADLELVDLIEWYMSSEGFARTAYDEQEKTGEEIAWDTSAEQTRQRGKFIVAAYHEIVAPRIQPLRVETAFDVDFGLPVPMRGRFDLEQSASTVDFKTGRQARKKPKEDWRIQAAVYTEATNKPVEFHSLTASAKTNAVTIVTPLESEELLLAPTTTERQEMRRTLRAIAAELCMYMSIYGPDNPWPTKGRMHDWACSYCGFRAGCPAWRQ
jgi:PD-(D/E)XK nuclease superfamily protein